MDKLSSLVSRVLNIDVSSVGDDTSPESIESWDSFNGLVLVTELEKEFKVKFSIEEIVSVKNVGDIRRALKEHGVML